MREESPSHAALYDRIKGAVLENGLGPGRRIDLQRVADAHRVSTTPVREVLSQLMGERLVEQHPAGGFQPTLLDARSLHDLYAWNGHHLSAAVHLLPDPIMRKVVAGNAGGSAGDVVLATERLFRAIATATGNDEFLAIIAAANDRLHRARVTEARLFVDRSREYASLVKTNGFDVRNNVRRRLAAYHRRRAEHAAQIAALIA